MTGSRRVRVGQLVDQDERRLAGQRGVEIEFLQGGATVLHRAPGEDFETAQQRFRLRAPVQLHVADDDVDAVLALLPGRLQHRVGLADAGGRAEEHLQLPAPPLSLLCLDPGQQRVGIGRWAAHDR